MTVDTRDVNELGPGKFRTSADNGQEQVCYFNKNKSDTHFTSYTSKSISSETLLFSIVKVNSDFNLVNKSLEIELKNSLLDGNSKSKYQRVNREDLNNGKSDRSETSKPTLQQQRDGQLDEDGGVRIKPRFLSADQ